MEKLNEMSIEELDLSIRTTNCLVRAGIYSVGDLLEKIKTPDDLYHIKNIGTKSVEELKRKLESLGIGQFKSQSNDAEEPKTKRYLKFNETELPSEIVERILLACGKDIVLFRFARLPAVMWFTIFQNLFQIKRMMNINHIRQVF